MSKVKTEMRELQEQHKMLDRKTTDLEKERRANRSPTLKFELVELKKEKLKIRDKINNLRLLQEQDNG
jgi:uncharacterized protein YdcH (DUF465 family)